MGPLRPSRHITCLELSQRTPQRLAAFQKTLYATKRSGFNQLQLLRLGLQKHER